MKPPAPVTSTRGLAPGAHFSPSGSSACGPRRSAQHVPSKGAPKAVPSSASVRVARITLIAADGTSEKPSHGCAMTPSAAGSAGEPTQGARRLEQALRDGGPGRQCCGSGYPGPPRCGAGAAGSAPDPHGPALERFRSMSTAARRPHRRLAGLSLKALRPLRGRCSARPLTPPPKQHADDGRGHPKDNLARRCIGPAPTGMTSGGAKGIRIPNPLLAKSPKGFRERVIEHVRGVVGYPITPISYPTAVLFWGTNLGVLPTQSWQWRSHCKAAPRVAEVVRSPPPLFLPVGSLR